MNVSVLLSSGDTDIWEDIQEVSVDMTLSGALVITAATSVGKDAFFTAAVYAPGMWMKFEREEPDAEA